MDKKADSTQSDLDRRAFLRLSGLLGLGLASASILPAKAEAVRFNKKLQKISSTRLAMGTFVSMTLVHPSRDQAEEAMGQAYGEIERLNRIMSRFDETTAVAELNKEGFLKEVPPEVAEVVDRALEYYRISRGKFDITVKPVVDLFWKSFSAGKKSAPSERALREALQLVGAHKIDLEGRTIRFEKPGMGITLDGIAKGYIVDRASRVLTAHEIENHLINAGGDIRTVGLRQDRKPWTVAVQDPEKKGSYPDTIHMTDGAVATSGNYEVYFDREKMFHHIVDPRTGHSPELSTSVSVLAESAMEADALSTAVFVADPTGGLGLIESRSNCECLIIDQHGKIHKSSGWKSTHA